VRAAPLIAWALLFGASCRRTHEVPQIDPSLRASAPAAPEEEAVVEGVPSWVPPLPKAVPPPRVDAAVPYAPPAPRPEQISAALAGAQQQMTNCADGAELPVGTHLSLKVSYSISPAGDVGGITVAGEAPETVRTCLRGVVSGLKVPAFAGPPVSLTFPIEYSRGLRVPDAGAR
jgi:hypothetical protein